MDTIKTDIKAMFLEKDDCDAGTVQRLRDGLSQGPSQYKTLRESIDAMKLKLDANAGNKKWNLKLGIACWFMGRIRESAEYLKHADTALSQYYLGKALTQLNEIDEAHKAFERAEKMGYTAGQVHLQRVGLHRMQGHLKQAKDLLHKHDALSSHSGEFHYQHGCIQVDEGDKLAAVVSFEKAVSLEPQHGAALFQLGYYNDLAGNDEDAIDYYEKSVENLPSHIGALNNLGILYEDHGKFELSYECFRQLSEANPNDERARLFLKDTEAARETSFELDPERRFDKYSQILEVPVTDFELSVRSRNCLKKMNIKTLGDLTRVTESQLLASKNFGETSLDEIKIVLTAKGLRLGQAMEEGARYDPRFRVNQQPLSPEEQAAMNRPVSELNLSVRSRKCMNRLGISTIGELISRSADELLEMKNFGQTSLLEIREKLTEQSLRLRGD